MEKNVNKSKSNKKKQFINISEIDHFVAKYLGWFLYPTSKQGKEKKHQEFLNKIIE